MNDTMDIEAFFNQECDYGLVANIDVDREVEINSSGQVGSNFVFDIDLSIPCDQVGDTINLQLIYCNTLEEEVCYLFPLVLKCTEDCIDTRIEDRSDNIGNQIRIFPNPSSGFFHIQFNNLEKRQHKVQIMDQYGRNVWNQISSQEQLDVDINNLNAGLYIIKITNEVDNTVFSEKIILIN